MPDQSLPQRATSDGTKRPLDDFYAALNGERTKKIIFPQELGTYPMFISLRVHEHEFLRKNDFAKERAICDIHLPLPSNLGTQYGQSYNADAIGLGGVIGAKATQTGMSGGFESLVDKVASITRKDVAKLATYYGVQAAEQNVGAIVGAGIGGIPGGLAGLAAEQALKGGIAAAGVARNPYMAVMYGAPQFRSHRFAWKLIPKNRADTIVLREVITALKYFSAPSLNKTNAHFLDYPQMFDIDISRPNFLFNIGPSVLTELEVNYHGEGMPLYFNFESDPNGEQLAEATEKAPVSVQINTSFLETVIVTKEQIRNNDR